MAGAVEASRAAPMAVGLPWLPQGRGQGIPPHFLPHWWCFSALQQLRCGAQRGFGTSSTISWCPLGSLPPHTGMVSLNLQHLPFPKLCFPTPLQC